MDKQSVIGFVLIGIILMVWIYFTTPTQQQVPPAQKQDTAAARVVEKPLPVAEVKSDTLGRFFSGLPAAGESTVTVETDLYRAVFTTHGGLLKEWTLKHHTDWENQPVELVDYQSGGDMSLLFMTTDGKLINTRNFSFKTGSFNQVLKGTDEYTLQFELDLPGGRAIIKRFILKNGSYSFDTDFTLVNMGDVIANFEYQIVWENSLRLTEKNSVDETNYSEAFAYTGRELTEVNASAYDKYDKADVTGSTDWVAMKNKYFALAMIPRSVKGSGAVITGLRRGAPDNGLLKLYTLALKVPYNGGASERMTMTVYLGPLDYYILKGYDVDLQKIMKFGIEWLVRPIAVYFMLPLFTFLKSFIPNYGVIIIIFTFIIRLLLYPLTKSSMKSMKKMQALQPMMNEIREKHKDDPEKMNREIMGLYRDYGVNPAGGCLPFILQLPILLALYNVFSTAIELRHASFALWMTDLSAPDVIVHLPFTIPIFGGNHISGLSLFMGVSMFIQQKMTIKDPRQKAMIWLFPILMTLMFNNWPSGLNLYYAMFNLTMSAQQFWTNRFGKDEPLRKVETKKKRGGVFSKWYDSLPTSQNRKR